MSTFSRQDNNLKEDRCNIKKASRTENKLYNVCFATRGTYKLCEKIDCSKLDCKYKLY